MNVSIFQERVYALVKQIPAGKVTTYQAVARALQCNSAQAIGQALKRNPFAPDVPCHRVIRTDLTLGGFKGVVAGTAIQEKIALLAKEGVRFEAGMLQDVKCLYDFSY